MQPTIRPCRINTIKMSLLFAPSDFIIPISQVIDETISIMIVTMAKEADSTPKYPARLINPIPERIPARIFLLLLQLSEP